MGISSIRNNSMVRFLHTKILQYKNSVELFHILIFFPIFEINRYAIILLQCFQPFYLMVHMIVQLSSMTSTTAMLFPLGAKHIVSFPTDCQCISNDKG